MKYTTKLSLFLLSSLPQSALPSLSPSWLLSQLKPGVMILWLSMLLSGCATLDTLQLLVGNKLASHSWQASKQQSTLPFQLLNQHIIVNMSVNGGANLRMIVDTGAAATLLFETDRTRFLINQLDGSIPVGGMGEQNKPDAYLLRDTHLTLGDATISGLTTLFIKANSNPLFETPNIIYADGVIGYDLFSRFVTQINFTHQTITISEAQETLPPGYQSIPIDIKGNLPYLDITLTGQTQNAQLSVLFDTGAVGSLLLKDKQNLPEGQALYTSEASGIAGTMPVTTERFASAAIGQHRITDIIASVSQQSSGQHIMGTGLINRFNIIVNYQDAEIALKPNRHYHKPDTPNKLGTTLLPHTHGAYISRLRPDSEAVRMGLQQGDVLSKVNNIPISYQNFDVIDQQLAQFDDVKTLCFHREIPTSSAAQPCRQLKIE